MDYSESRIMKRPVHLWLFCLIVVGVTSCRAFWLPAPDSDAKIDHSLSGFLVMECLDSTTTLCGLDLAREPEQVTIRACEGRCSQVFVTVTDAGSKVVYLEQSPKSDDIIWGFSLDEQHPQTLVEDEHPKTHPTWSPQGDRLAYIVLHDPYMLSSKPVDVTPMVTTVPDLLAYRYSTLYVLELATGDELQVTPTQTRVMDYAWSPDGKHILLNGYLEDTEQDGNVDARDVLELYTVSLPDLSIERIPDATTMEDSRRQPSWSSDGRYLAYIGNESYLVVLKATTYDEIARFEIAASSEESRWYKWAPQGTKIAYIGASDESHSVQGFVDLFVFDLETGAHTRLSDTSAYTTFGVYTRRGIKLYDPTWSPDGTFIAVAWQTRGQSYLVVSSGDGSQISRVAELEDYYRLVFWTELQY